MREIKFRFWMGNYAKPIYEYSDNLIKLEQERDCQILAGYLMTKRAEIVKEQYTGLKDRNGVEIYEGDILFDDFNNEIGYVVWNEDDLRYEICFYDSEYADVYELLDKNYANGLKIVGNLNDKKNKK